MIIRVRGPDGMVRVMLETHHTFADLVRELVSKLPSTVDPQSITLSNAPTGDAKTVNEVGSLQLGQVGLKHGDMVFVRYQHWDEGAAAALDAAQPRLATFSGRVDGKPMREDQEALAKVSINVKDAARQWEMVRQSPLDDYLDKQTGLIPRSKGAMCRHGPKGMCDYCTPLEPYDANYLSENGIKYPSFHAYLRKVNAATNKEEQGSSFIPPLSEPDYRVKTLCPSGHPAWPEGICSKCQPSAITLQPQTFRMVDHVEFSSPALVDSFLNAWRRTGAQRIGFLYGYYAEYTKVPLGTKAVVEAIYEAPQVDEVDGVSLELWDNEKDVDAMAQYCGLQRVGVIWTDLVDAGNRDGTVVCKRHADSYFFASQEICFSARLQAQFPKVTKWSRSGQFGSDFVTCVISGNEEGQIDIAAYQMSNVAVEMVRADIIEPSADPGIMLVRDEHDEADEDEIAGEHALRESNASSTSKGKSKRVRYIPEVFYRRVNQYGANVQENAKPAFPVEYLFVTLTHGFPDVAAPVFTDVGFPIENRRHVGESQEYRDVAKMLVRGKEAQVSNFHLLCFLQQIGVFSRDEQKLIARAAIFRWKPPPNVQTTIASTNAGNAVDADGALASLQASDGWRTLEAILQSTG